jgi:YD repeat-containing protein
MQSITFLGLDTNVTERKMLDYTYDNSGRLIIIKETYFNKDYAVNANTGNTAYVYDTTGNVVAVNREGKANYKLSYGKNGLLKSKTIKMPEEFSNIGIMDEYNYSFRQ